ncbi:hypothetical protein FD723_22175 [Nostoc sp. C052]|nr:hypothetical protein FD723_22175 [Nostoc sp. C052]
MSKTIKFHSYIDRYVSYRIQSIHFPAHWTRYRDQWEYAHAVNAFIKIIGLSLLVISVLVETPKMEKLD